MSETRGAIVGTRILAGVALGLLLMTGAASSAQPFKGKIVELDPTLGKVTLTHGAIARLGMPAGMTMRYRVENRTQLEGLRTGDRVEFEARDDGGSYTITAIEKAR